MDTPPPPERQTRVADGPKRARLMVGIGAPPGTPSGLAGFLAGISADTGAAFMIIQPAGPDDADCADPFADPLERIRAMTPLPVVMVEPGMAPAPDRIHVAPPDAVLTVEDGIFRLRPFADLAERRQVIDLFFGSLARDAGSQAVAVLITGTAGDGLAGLETVGAAGGMAMAEIPAEPDVDGAMNACALAAVVDHAGPAADLAQILAAYARDAEEAVAASDPVIQAGEVADRLSEICVILRDRTGHEFRHYKASTLVRRTWRRMQMLQCRDVQAYIDDLSADPQEAQSLFKELLIGVTGFFRDPEAFEALVEQVLAPLTAGRTAGEELRIWVPGCATGEEAYSIAMLVQERLAGHPSPPAVLILATDIDERALAVARRGDYPPGIADQVSPERIVPSPPCSQKPSRAAASLSNPPEAQYSAPSGRPSS